MRGETRTTPDHQPRLFQRPSAAGYHLLNQIVCVRVCMCAIVLTYHMLPHYTCLVCRGHTWHHRVCVSVVWLNKVGIFRSSLAPFPVSSQQD